MPICVHQINHGCVPKLVVCYAYGTCSAVSFILLIAVSSGSLVKQAIADDTKPGQAAKAYIEKSMMGKMQI